MAVVARPCGQRCPRDNTGDALDGVGGELRGSGLVIVGIIARGLVLAK